MDTRAKKKIEVLQKKLGTLRQRLAGARRQMDDPAEVTRLESEIRAAEAEVARLRQGDA